MRCRRVANAAGAQLSSCKNFRSNQQHLARPHCTARQLCSSARPTSRCDGTRPKTTIRETRRPLYTEVNGNLRRDKPVADFPDFQATMEYPPPEDLPRAPKVAVIGAGATGLSTAYYLAENLPPRAQITVYEGDKRVGGWIRSEHVDTGDGEERLLERGPRMISMAQSGGRLDRMVVYDLLMNLGLPTAQGVSHDLPRWIWHDGQLVQVPPSSLRDVLDTTLWAEIGPKALLNYLVNFKLFKKVFNEDMSVAQWAEAMLGSRKLADVLVSAMVHGIWGGDARKLSAQSVLGETFFGNAKPNPVHENRTVSSSREMLFFRNFVEPREYLYDYFIHEDARQIRLDRFGLEALPQALADTLKSDPRVNLQMENPVKQLSYSKSQDKIMVHHSKGRPEVFDKVISTLPAHQLAKVTDEKLPTLEELESVSIMTVNLWYPGGKLVPEGLGYLIPSTPWEENPELALGVLFDSECGIGVSPKGPSQPIIEADELGTKVFVLLGGHHYHKHPDKIPTKQEAISQAKKVLLRHLGIPMHLPCHASARFADKCLPQHYVGHKQKMQSLSEELKDNYNGRLAVAGGSFGRPGVSAALRTGWDIAFRTASQEFLCNGLEDFKEGPLYWVESFSDRDMINYSAMTRKKG